MNLNPYDLGNRLIVLCGIPLVDTSGGKKRKGSCYATEQLAGELKNPETYIRNSYH